MNESTKLYKVNGLFVFLREETMWPQKNGIAISGAFVQEIQNLEKIDKCKINNRYKEMEKIMLSNTPSSSSKFWNGCLSSVSLLRDEMQAILASYFGSVKGTHKSKSSWSFRISLFDKMFLQSFKEDSVLTISLFLKCLINFHAFWK